MAKTPLTEREPRLENLRVLVIGIGRSGLAAAGLAVDRGARVTVVDRRSEDELGPLTEQARARGAAVLVGGHPAEMASEFDLVVVSPGVPVNTPLLEAARRLDVPVWGEVELAWRFCRGRILGITGSNGKSTVTSMAGTILRSAGIPGGTGGNLGIPLSTLLADDSPEAVHAVELSSFQLETIDVFRPEVAVVVNLSPDHLDRHESFDAYVAAKTRILEAQDDNGFAVLNADDPESSRLTEKVRGRLLRFSTRGPVDSGAWVEDGALVLQTAARREAIMRADTLPVPGEHNVANALAAALACRLVGCSTARIASGLASYRALPHRLEHVATVNGVEFYDDSKATNLDAAVRAIRSFPSKSVHLILGGRDKGAHWSSIASLVGEHARRVLLVGEAAGVIRDGLETASETLDCGTVAEAVRIAFTDARSGEVVLLSPGCASFDQYRNFEERGDDFKQAVHALERERGGDA